MFSFLIFIRKNILFSNYTVSVRIDTDNSYLKTY